MKNLGSMRRYDAKTFFETTEFRGASFSTDETRLLVTSDASGVFNIYIQPVAGGEPEQLTWSETDAIFGIDYFPRDDRILYSSDEGGNELNHVYVLERDGRVVDLTPGKGFKASFLDWSGDESRLWILTNERDPKYFDLYRYDAETYERALVFENTGEYGTVQEVSPDGRWLALLKARTNADDDIYLWDAENQEDPPRLITLHEGDIRNRPADFTPDSRELLYLSNRDSEFNRLWAYNQAEGEHRFLEGAKWDIMYSHFSRNGRFRITGINVDARAEITIFDAEEGKPVELPDIPRGDITLVRVSKSSRYIAFYVNGDTSPSNLYLIDLDSGEHARLTDSLNPAIDESHLVNGEVVRYPSYDGLVIPSLIYKPHAASPQNKVPALVYVHGGPGGQTRFEYNALRQFLVNHDYAIFAVNNRGSAGYGKTFFHMDDKRHGDVDLKDCVHGRKYLEGLEWIDPDKIGIIGESYGGFMVAAALAFEPEAFDVGVDIFGVTNWVRTLRSIPPWWEDFREALYAELGDPENELERLTKISPLFHAGNIRKPLLVIQGKNDPRVLQVESNEIVEAVRKNNVPVEYIVFPDEGHGFVKKSNRIAAAEAYLRFLDTHLKGK